MSPQASNEPCAEAWRSDGGDAQRPGPQDPAHETTAAAATASALSVTVRLLSGATVGTWQHRPNDLVRSVLSRAVAAADFGNRSCVILLGLEALDPGWTLAAAGVADGAGLTLAARAFSWQGSLLGTNVSLEVAGEDSTIATPGSLVARRGDKCWSNGLVIARHPSRCFSFRVLNNSDIWSGSVELGFMEVPGAMLEDQSVELPMSLSMASRWITENYGHAAPNLWYTDLVGDICDSGGILQKSRILGVDGEPASKSKFDAVSLKGGDEVVCEVGTSGEFCIFVNRKLAFAEPCDIPQHLDLHPVINVCGKMIALELLI